MMKYCSTRGGVCGWDFRDVLFSGFAPDGGMFMPERIPHLSSALLRGWVGLSYPRVVVEVMSLFIPAQVLPREELEGTATYSFTSIYNLYFTYDMSSNLFLCMVSSSGGCGPFPVLHT